ncbi:MAG TPA: histidine kinase [Ktedonobacter sp.]|nr:histidine kinase [Ktedonobacter sp.]
MGWSPFSRAEDVYDQVVVLVGSAIRLLRGECGVFVVSNEAFDLQSSREYTAYRMDEAATEFLVSLAQEGLQPSTRQPLVVEALSNDVLQQLGIEDVQAPAELCSLFLYDTHGSPGILYYIRHAHVRSCFEQVYQEQQGQELLHLFITQLASGIRFALRAQSLMKEQGRLSAIFQFSMEGILTVDNALRIIDFNPAMERLTGWRESEVLGRFYFDVLRPKDRFGNELGLDDSPILQAFAGQVVVNREMALTTRDGQQVDVSVTASCVRSSRGEPVNGILNVRDITLERQQEEQRSTFISVISHELQTPIAIIKGYASTLARTDAPLDSNALHIRLNAIEEEADRLNKLVANLLYASRIQAGGIQMEIGPLDLKPLIESVVRRLSARMKDVEVTLDIPEPLPLVMADRDRIEEVLQNLLDNAIKYSPRQRTLHIACHATGEEVITSVSDVGMGISLRDQEHIFDRFERVGDPLAQATPGAGLGLYICRVIVEAHGGRIWVESALRQGSTFSFSLPREEKAHLPVVVF